MKKLISLCIIATMLYSCKKDNTTTPKTVVQTTPNSYSEEVYVRISNIICNEVDTLWIMHNNGITTISCPIIAGTPDTMLLNYNAPLLQSFHAQMRAYPEKIDGSVLTTTTGLKLTFSIENTITNTMICSVTDIVYNKL